MKDLEKIFRYTDGEMPNEEKQEFATVLTEDKILNQTKFLVEEIDSVISNEQTFEFIGKLKETQALYNSIIDLNYSIGEDIEITAPQTKRVCWRQIAAAVITFLLIISTVFFNFSKTSNRKIFIGYYEPYKVNNTHSRALQSNTANRLIDDAAFFYDKGNYKGALQLCEQMVRSDRKNVPAQFFSGISCMELNNYNKAIDNFTFVVKQNDVYYSRQAEWYLALCFFETDQIERATSLLTSIAKSNTYYKQKASDILRTIK